ncbi:MAG: hypothetical protein AAGG68_31135, partial [Bacteroidota bacterium]
LGWPFWTEMMLSLIIFGKNHQRQHHFCPNVLLKMESKTSFLIPFSKNNVRQVDKLINKL